MLYRYFSPNNETVKGGIAPLEMGEINKQNEI